MDDYLETVPHAENPFRKAQGWDDKFVVMYSGNHSLVHPLDTLLDAAEQLKDDPRFVFAFIGGGKGKQAVEDRVAELKAERCSLNGESAATNNKQQTTSNLISLPYQPLDQIKYSLSAADLHIVSLGDNMSGIVHPCKIYGALSIGRPVLTLGPKDSYLSDIVETEGRGQRTEVSSQTQNVGASLGCTPATSHQQSAISHQSLQAKPVGWAIEHGDVTAAVAALKAAADQTQQERAAIGLRAKIVAEQNYNRQRLVERFIATLLDD
jgi:glycosyltransferase involved in cell wall biosynthesis